MDISPPEVTLIETALAAVADLADALPGDTARNAAVADRIAEEAAEVGLRLRCLPGAPVPMSGRDAAALAALRSSHVEHEDVGEFVARTLARLAAELGSSHAVIANRSGRWEAAAVRDLLRGAVGPMTRTCTPTGSPDNRSDHRGSGHRLSGVPPRPFACQLPAWLGPRAPRRQSVLVIRPRSLGQHPRPVRHPHRPPALRPSARAYRSQLHGL